MAKANFKFDVVIVGGGLVGMTAAAACAQAGFSIAIVDLKEPTLQLGEKFDGRSSAIAAASFKMMRALGVADALVDGDDTHAGPITKILVSDGEAGKAPSPLSLFFDAAQIFESNDNGPLGYMVENRRMYAALQQTIAKMDNISWIAPAKITAIATGPGESVVSLADGRVLTAALVVAADGRNSFVRKQAGIAVTEWPCNQSALVTTVEHDLPHEGIAHELFLPSGPFAILPLTGNRASIVWTETPRAAEAAMALSDEAFEAELARRFGDFLGEVRVIAPRWSYPLSFLHANTYIADRTVLIGDAAHAIHPIAGQGFNMGLRDAAALAEILVQARSEGRDIGSVLTLSEFEDWRKFDNTLLTHACDVFNRLFSNNIGPIKHVRRLGLGLVDKIAPARGFFMREASGQTGELPPLLRGLKYERPAS